MTYAIRLASAETRDLVVDALRQASEQRTRAARKLAGAVAAERRTGKDVRPQALKVTGLLAEADDLAQVAEELATAPEVPVVARTLEEAGRDLAEAFTVPPGTEANAVTLTSVDDDGTSPEAQAAAALAGLEPAADPEDPPVEDPETGALPEDSADVEDAAALALTEAPA